MYKVLRIILCDIDPEVKCCILFLNDMTLQLRTLQEHRSHDVECVGQYLV